MEDHDPWQGFWSRGRWLARLSLSFLIVGAWLIWTGYHGAQAHTLSSARTLLCYAAGGLAIGLFFMGVRERHRRE